MSEKVYCGECKWLGLLSDVLRAPNPFDAADELLGCPECKAPNEIMRRCDEDGCNRPASCGTPTPTGYKQSCFEHRPTP